MAHRALVAPLDCCGYLIKVSVCAYWLLGYGLLSAAMPIVSLDALVFDADTIVVARPAAISEREEKGDFNIKYRKVNLHNIEILKGSLKKESSISFSYLPKTSNSPTIAVGNEYIFFLKRSALDFEPLLAHRGVFPIKQGIVRTQGSVKEEELVRDEFLTRIRERVAHKK